jgi:hypothetical protein
MAKSVLCITKTDAQAIAIVDRLKTAGFSHNDLSVLLPDKAGTKDFAHEQHTKAPEGAGTGGVTRTLIRMGIPKYEAKRYEGKIKEGNMLISVHADDSTERDRAKTIFEQAGAEDISSTEEARV